MLTTHVAASKGPSLGGIEGSTFKFCNTVRERMGFADEIDLRR